MCAICFVGFPIVEILAQHPRANRNRARGGLRLDSLYEECTILELHCLLDDGAWRCEVAEVGQRKSALA